MSPDSSGIDDYLGVIIRLLASCVIQDSNALYGISGNMETGDLGTYQDLCSVKLRVDHIGGAEPEWIHATIRNPYGSDNVRIDRRFQTQGFLRVYDLGLDSGRQTRLDKGLLISKIVFRQSNKKT